MSKKSVIGTTSVGVFSSILAFLGVVSCCGMPIVAGVLAWLGIGASQLSFFAEYRPLFIGVAIVALLFGFWQAYFKKTSSCCTTANSCCGTPTKDEKPKSNIVQKIFLWIGAIAVIAMLFMGNQSEPTPETSPLAPAVQIQSEQPGCCPSQPATESVQESKSQTPGCCPQ